MFRRRARADRELREAQREALALIRMHARQPLPFDSVQAPASAGSSSEAIVPDLPSADLWAPSRQDVEE